MEKNIMTSLVGTQKDFANALKELIELDYDAIEAYEAAIERIKNEDYKNQFQKFKKDHERHIEELNNILINHGKSSVTEPSLKQWLTKGKVILADLVGDSGIMYAMLTNEEDTNTAYERLNNHPEKWEDASEALKQGLLDEKNHKKWIEENMDKV